VDASGRYGSKVVLLHRGRVAGGAVMVELQISDPELNEGSNWNPNYVDRSLIELKDISTNRSKID